MGKPKTPLRYPGGKQRLTPFVIQVIEANDLVGCEYAEPFAGGAGIACELLLQGKVSRVHLNDVSYPIYSFWRSILNDTERFCSRILGVKLSVETWKRQRLIYQNPDSYDMFDVGFSTFYLNRCNRSGILNGGLIGGLAQEGEWLMDARFPRRQLVERIESLAKVKKKIRLRNWDAEKFIKVYLKSLSEENLVFCDPPYYRKANRLYPNYYQPLDHERIAKVIQGEISQRWLVSYDDVPEIRKLYAAVRMTDYQLQYSAAKSSVGREIIAFSSDLILPSSVRVTSNFIASPE